MAEPARKLDELQEYDDEGDQPFLESIPGGGENSPRRAGHLRSIPGGGETGATPAKPRRHLSAVPDIEKAEESAAKPESQEPEAHQKTKADKEASFYRDNEENNGRLRAAISRRRRLIFGGSIISLVIGLTMGFFGFFSVFRIDQILNLVDVQTFARFNASFEGRSDAWFRAYIKLRLTEWGGDYSNAGGENLYFRSNRVDTDNPIRDWYRTLRTSRFERDLFEKSGIRFTSLVDPDGNIRQGVITINDQQIPFDVLNRPDIDFDLLASGDLDQLNRIIPDIDGLVDVEIFQNNQEARRTVKLVVNDITKRRQVFRRRHLRKDINNMTGIRDWRMFEKTRDNIDNAKIGIQQKIINKTFAGDRMRFLRCLLGGSRCPNTTDPVDPDNKAGGAPDGDLDETDDNGRQIDPETGEVLTDADGNEVRGPTNGNAVADAAEEAVSEGIEEATDGSYTRTITRRLVDIIGRGGNLWEWAKRLTSIHHMFAGGANSQIVTLVYNARIAQLAGLFTAATIARDQMHSGELVPDELNGFYEMTKNFGNSEAWEAVSQGANDSTVSAQEATGARRLSKEEYCDSDHERTFDEYAWFCDQFKPGGGSRAGTLADAYSRTIGYLIAPIAAAVDGVNSIPVVGNIINALGDALGNVGAVFGDALLSALQSAGLADNVTSVMATISNWLLRFAGGGPFINPTEPGFPSWIVGGSAGTAETTARASGGVQSTEETLLFTNKLAADYRQEQLESRSWSERYLSLANPDSVAASVAFSISGVLVGESVVGKFTTSLAKAPTTFISMLTPGARAAPPSTNLANLAGVETYDMPAVCMNLYPMAPDYLERATNADIGVRTFENIGNEDSFWQTVYERPQPVPIKQIYNCAIFDKRVRGSSAYRYGYKDDGGYEVNAGTAPTTNTEADADLPIEIVQGDIPCPVGTDQGVQDGYQGGDLRRIKICEVRGTLVYAGVAENFDRMIAAAQAAGVNISGGPGFRTMAQQQALYDENCSSRGCFPDTARPGYSNHQMGLAVDFRYNGQSICYPNNSAACAARNHPGFRWMAENAENFGYHNYPREAWHWSITGQ